MIASVRLERTPLVIGRGDDCGLVLPATAVSRKHATVQLQPDGSVVLQDEGSANGVKLNGKLIDRPVVVDPRTRIEISRFVLTLEPVEVAVEERAAVPASKGKRAVAGTRLEEGAANAARLTTAFDAEEFDTVLEPQAASALALAASRLQLLGRGGPYDGTVLQLDKAMLVVGRTSESDLPLEDPSISRRHAQIRLSVRGDSFTLVDLRSSNGTFVDGQRVKRAECRPGQVVRFGDLAFKVTVEDRQQAAKVRRPPRRRLVLAASLMVMVIGAVGGLAYVRRSKGRKVEVITPEQKLRELAADVQRSVDEARRRIQQREWNQAVTVLELARTRDPLNAEIPRLRVKALAELENEHTVKQGMELFALGNRENLTKARAVFERVPTGSTYYRETRYRLKAIDERLAEDYRVDGVSHYAARRWPECQVSLCKFFTLLAPETVVSGEARLREMLREAEKRAGPKGLQGCAARRFVEGAPRTASGADMMALLEERYPVGKLREVLLAYVEGKLDVSLKRLSAARNDRRQRPHLAAIIEVSGQLQIIKGKYQEGYSAYRERDVERARRNWDLVLAADAALLPPGVESFHRKEVTRSLGDLYSDLGDEEFKAGRYRLAFGLWSKGKAVYARHERILNGLLQLEKEADRMIRAGQKLAADGKVSEAIEKLTVARDVTEADGPTHKEAEKALSEVGR